MSWSPGNFSKSTNVNTVRQDLYTSILTDLRKRGFVPPSSGLTKATPRFDTSEDFTTTLGQLLSDQRQRRRGATFDTTETPVNATYRQRRYDFLKRHEASRTLAYDDATGKPVTSGPITGNVTVGIGFNMERPDSPEVFQKATGLGRAEFDAVKSGRRRLSEQEVRALFDHTIQEAEDIVSSRLGDDLPEHERIAAVSMAFNGPSLIGPKFTAAIKSGDRRAALNEILYNSNAKRINGLYNRRYAEAALFAGPANAESILPDFGSYKREVGFG